MSKFNYHKTCGPICRFSVSLANKTYHVKITSKATNFIILIAVLHMLCIAIVGTLKIGHVDYPTFVRYFVNFFIEGTYIITLFYLYHLLKYVNEKRNIIIAFWAYLVYDAFAFLLRMFVIGTSIINGNWVFNLITAGVTLYFIIVVSGVSNPSLEKSFKLLTSAIFLSSIIRIVAAVLLIQHYAGRSMLWYMVAAELLPPFAMLHILFKTVAYLKHRQQVFKQATFSADEPA